MLLGLLSTSGISTLILMLSIGEYLTADRDCMFSIQCSTWECRKKFNYRAN